MTTTRKEPPEPETNPARGRGAIAASRQSARLTKAAARREAILEAALDEFSARGFAAARLEDVAKRAGVAKGTIYLYFADKEALFQELVRFQIGPVMSAFETVLASPLPLKSLIDQAIEIFTREVFGTRRKQVMRLIISEGPRFPALAEFYYREVLGTDPESGAGAAATRTRARRNRRRCSRPLSAIARRRDRHGRGLAGIVRPFRAPRCARDDPRLFRSAFWLGWEAGMSVPRLAGMAVLCAVAFAPASCSKQSANAYQGWVEANLIFVAPDETGRVRTLTVQEGDTVKTGDLLFTVDDDLQQADLAQVKASVKNAQQTFDRASMLVKTGAGTQKDFDAAEMILRDAQARLNSVQTRLSRRNVFSAVGGTVQQIYFRPGEMVPAGRPVLSLLPPGNIKVRFYVPEAVLPTVAYGDEINVTCDGCASGLTARVSFIAKQSEFTPPVIYSLEERAKLVFLIEALPEKPSEFRVGQPVDVTLTHRPPATVPKVAAKPEALR